MHNALNNSNETNFLYLDDDVVGGNMVLQGLNIEPTTATVAPTGKPEVILALTVVLVVLIILLIISIFLLLYCVLKRQEGRIERRKREDYERQKMQSKNIVSNSARKAKVSQIAANIEAAVKSAESTLKSSQILSKESISSTTPLPPALELRPKPISKKLPTLPSPSETAVEAPSPFITQIFVSRRHNPWQQVDREPSDFSYELESDSANDNIYLQPL
ncbi:Alpha-2B adrenergic receptor [Dirofilaria immitis]